MKNYIVTSLEQGQFIGGNKAKDDVTFFLTQKADFYKLNILIHKNKIRKFIYSNFQLKNEIIHSNADNFILQYPVVSEYLERKFINLIRRYTKAKIYFLIHDISGLQYPDIVSSGFSKRELELFRSTDGLIVHNQAMEDWLHQHNVNVKMVQLGLFDYKSDDPMQPNIPFEKTVCFAGGLGRAGFLQKLDVRTKIHAMGPNPLPGYPSNVIYDGKFLPSELNAHLLQNFGLVWSGDRTDTCSGNLGHYLKYNDPHKVSLYLSNGIPVIIWKQAALATEIEENGLGFSISSLSEIDEKMNNITEADYKQMKDKAQEIGYQLRNGHFIIQAANAIIG